MDEQKNVLVVARGRMIEALRMASGLTLLDDRVEVVVLGTLPEGPAATEQLEALDFAEVPLAYFDAETDESFAALAQRVCAADAVFVL